ncbi:MAG: flavodoxin family protein [Synergistetes bacterium]|nr:MAG: NADPH-dependent FMN reductase [bacterium 42_11]MBC7331328.1 flavodoxin family protein [Synergistota bacterium]MDK2871278.1 hypothetical protein [bacterium]
MLIVGINGSPRKNGNTAFLLGVALEAAKSFGAQTHLIHAVDALVGQESPFCVVCSNPCEGRCSKNNALGEAFDVLRKADGIIVGSPVHFGTVSAQLKAFWDRTRILRKEKALLNVVGGAITVARSRFGGQETTLKALFDMMIIQGMIIVGNGYKEADAGHHGSCSQEPSDKDEFAIERARRLGLRVAEVAGATMSLRNRA